MHKRVFTVIASCLRAGLSISTSGASNTSRAPTSTGDSGRFQCTERPPKLSRNVYTYKIWSLKMLAIKEYIYTYTYIYIYFYIYKRRYNKYISWAMKEDLIQWLLKQKRDLTFQSAYDPSVWPYNNIADWNIYTLKISISAISPAWKKGKKTCNFPKVKPVKSHHRDLTTTQSAGFHGAVPLLKKSILLPGNNKTLF